MIFVAEIGSNWNTLNDCLTSIEKAKESKATVVKFQLFTPQDLMGPQHQNDVFKPGQSPYLDPAWIPALANKAKEVGIEFMCTAFSPDGYRYVNEYVNIHKVASAEMTDTTILAIVNSFKKPVFISTAGSSLDEIAKAVDRLCDCPVTIMFCVGDYPARVVDFKHMEKLKDRFNNRYMYGYSDHSTDVLNIPKMAVYYGATVIEKHVSFIASRQTNDAAHSINGEEFKLMVASCLGELDHDKTSEVMNKSMRTHWKRKFVAIRDIGEGDRLMIGVNYGIYRPMQYAYNAVSTFWDRPLTGQIAIKPIKAGSVITYDDLVE